MMQSKLFEVRDRATCIAVMVTALKESVGPDMYHTQQDQISWEREEKILAHAGFNSPSYTCYMVTKINSAESNSSPYHWGDRTLSTFHSYIELI